MKYRGPDHQSYKEYEIQNKKLYLLHSRLSIIDLEPRSNQPFENDGFAIVFNGEIYNHLELREKLKKDGFQSWNSSSDTETLLVCVEKYGLNKTLNMLEGMFAFALLDKLKKKNISC